jgi:putative acetyltransferase
LTDCDPRFQLTKSGRFCEREGALGRDAPRADQKLCLVATDPVLLADTLYGLSLRPDCVFVKYGAIERDGMILGRCFLATERAAAELCQALKAHPRLMVSLQNDGFFNQFREPAPPPGEPGVWDDWPEDAATVAELHQQAFERPDEADAVARLRAASAATVSLVAGIQNRLIGHVMLSPVTIHGHDVLRGLALGPLAVRPSEQRRGAGALLVRAAIERAKLLGYAYVVVLGDTRYFGRFGFQAAARFALRHEQPASDALLLALPLRARALDGVAGVVRYVPAFTRWTERAAKGDGPR